MIVCDLVSVEFLCAYIFIFYTIQLKLESTNNGMQAKKYDRACFGREKEREEGGRERRRD